MKRISVALLLALEYSLASEIINIDTSDAYQWTNQYPQSCTCIETGVSPSDCKLFQCKCACDVTAGKCDYNCCCDPDCTSDQVNTNIFQILTLYANHFIISSLDQSFQGFGRLFN